MGTFFSHNVQQTNKQWSVSAQKAFQMKVTCPKKLIVHIYGGILIWKELLASKRFYKVDPILYTEIFLVKKKLSEQKKIANNHRISWVFPKVYSDIVRLAALLMIRKI